jgi:hypothetical protein
VVVFRAVDQEKLGILTRASFNWVGVGQLASDISDITAKLESKILGKDKPPRPAKGGRAAIAEAGSAKDYLGSTDQDDHAHFSVNFMEIWSATAIISVSFG